jgi:2',3'-cyclic-nucleotide 2'-phosphodiesterase/3'-nucleotidase
VQRRGDIVARSLSRRLRAAAALTLSAALAGTALGVAGAPAGAAEPSPALSVTSTTPGASFDSITRLIDDYVAADRLNARVAAGLNDRLDHGEAAAIRGSEASAISYLEQFVARARNQVKGDARDAQVRDELVAAAQLLLAKYRAMDAEEDAGNAVTVTVMGTSDLHGNVFNWDYFRDAVYDDSRHDDVGLAKISTLVDRVRADRGGDHTLLFDSGDTIQGTPLTTYYAKVHPFDQYGETHPMAAAMNAIGYDAITLGNHEFNYGLPFLADWVDQLDAPVLAANAVDAATGAQAYTPYVIKTVKVKGQEPVRIGVLGLTNPGVAIWDKANVEGKERYLDLVATAKLWVPRIKAAGADVVVVTAHAGDSGFSSYGGDLPVENAAAMVAEQVPDVDAVLFGHAHNDVPQRFVTNSVTGEQVLLAEPAKWGSRLTVMDFDLERADGDWQVVDKRSTNLSTADNAGNFVPEDPEITALIKAQHDTTVDYVNTDVATSTEELSAAESRYKDTPIVDYIQKVQTEVVKKALAGTPRADLPVLSIAAPFSRTAVFPQGPVKVKDIAGLYIYDNTLEAVEMTGAQIKDYLEFSARYFNQLAPGAPVDVDALTNAGTPSTPDYNYDMFSGVSYDIDISQPVGSRIKNLTYAGAPVTADQRFVVAVNNYRRSGGGNFPHVSTAPVVYNAQVEIRQAIIDYASVTGVIDPDDFFEPNWKLVRAGVPVFG